MYVTVVQEFAKNYRSFLHRRHGAKKQSKTSKLGKIYAEELEPSKQHPHLADAVGFN